MLNIEIKYNKQHKIREKSDYNADGDIMEKIYLQENKNCPHSSKKKKVKKPQEMTYLVKIPVNVDMEKEILFTLEGCRQLLG